MLEGVAKAGGVTLIFDKDVRNDPISIPVQDTPFEDALNLILNSNSLFSRVVSPGVLIVSPNTKQEQYQDLMIRTFYLSTDKAKDMLVLLKGMLDSKRLHANEQLNDIIIRDQTGKVRAGGEDHPLQRSPGAGSALRSGSPRSESHEESNLWTELPQAGGRRISSAGVHGGVDGRSRPVHLSTADVFRSR